jgi:tetratricopeptide (TPR) repeat protein
MKKLIVSVALASLSVLAWALPSLQQVEAQVGQGNYAQAEAMMREVVAAKPDSARAHYIYAEILAHEHKFALAVEEAKAARTIDPDVKFTDPERFRTFEATLLRAQNPAARTPLTPSVESRAPAQTAPAHVAPAG